MELISRGSSSPVVFIVSLLSFRSFFVAHSIPKCL
uniref:Uncharacterized protein n=1 Tax=Rhizophora mucronata TaxID=61149 RepID=A0A2P2PZK6_RHIMU